MSLFGKKKKIIPKKERCAYTQELAKMFADDSQWNDVCGTGCTIEHIHTRQTLWIGNGPDHLNWWNSTQLSDIPDESRHYLSKIIQKVIKEKNSKSATQKMESTLNAIKNASASSKQKLEEPTTDDYVIELFKTIDPSQFDLLSDMAQMIPSMDMPPEDKDRASIDLRKFAGIMENMRYLLDS